VNTGGNPDSMLDKFFKKALNKPGLYASFIQRLPDKAQTTSLFLSCIFIFHIWSIPVFLYHASGMVFYMTIWDLFHVAAYNQALILLECVLLTSFLVLISVILPHHYLKDQFILQGNFIILITATFSVLLNRSEPLVIKFLPAWISMIDQQKIVSPTVRVLITSDSFILTVILIFLFSSWISLFVLSPYIFAVFHLGNLF
jgi:hypothetical protein